MPPVYDSFQDEEVQDIWYIVIPFLRPMNNPPFEYINDIVQFIDQTLEVRPPFPLRKFCD